MDPTFDALTTARAQLREEQDAVALCEARGYETDGRFARSEVARLTALIARLEARIVAQGSTTRCTDTPACRNRGCADCERSYGPKRR